MSRRCSSLLLVLSSMLFFLPPRPVAAEVDPVTIRYEVRGRGNTVDLEEFAAAVAAIYADGRGWAGGGAVRFERVAAGGHFVLWLAADPQMPSFGGACGPVWSCRSGDDVVINQDRWLGATPAWNEAGAPLGGYRHMVVNHETGHWLGLGHQTCTAPGDPAAVMQQQSMGLQGCRPNPWPLPVEHRRMETGRRLGALRTEPPGDAPAPPPWPAGVTDVRWRYSPWRLTMVPSV